MNWDELYRLLQLLSKILLAVVSLFGQISTTKETADHTQSVDIQTASPDLVSPTTSLVPVETGAPWNYDPEVSWYGPGFYGNLTACGQSYTTTILGVAHRTLPCGTLVEFRWQGRSAIVPVIDRGPYVEGRTWDLSGGLCVILEHCFTGAIDWRFVNG